MVFCFSYRNWQIFKEGGGFLGLKPLPKMYIFLWIFLNYYITYAICPKIFLFYFVKYCQFGIKGYWKTFYKPVKTVGWWQKGLLLIFFLKRMNKTTFLFSSFSKSEYKSKWFDRFSVLFLHWHNLFFFFFLSKNKTKQKKTEKKTWENKSRFHV